MAKGERARDDERRATVELVTLGLVCVAMLAIAAWLALSGVR